MPAAAIRQRARIQQIAGVIQPYSVVAGLAANYVYCAAYQMPLGLPTVAGKLQFEIGLANHDIKNNVNPGAYVMKGLASGRPNAGLNGWFTVPDTSLVNLNVPGDGSILWSAAEAVPDAQNRILLAWQMTAGANVAFEFGDGAAQIYGFVDASGATNVNALAGMVAVDGSTTVIGANILLRYNSPRPRLVVISDSIQRGIQYNGVPSTVVALNAVGSRGWSAAANGCASTTAQMWADPNHWGWTNYAIRGNAVLIALGENDIALGRSHVQLLADLQSCVANAKARGATSVGMYTITPNVAWTGAQNTIRNQTNADIVARTPGNAWSGDAYTAVKDPGNPDAVNPAFGGPIHLNTAGLTATSATIPVTI